jgi:hypothetical protein
VSTKAQSSDAVATGDTTRTLIGTLTLAQSAKRIIGVWCYACAAAAMTSTEAITGIFDLESPDVSDLKPLQLPLDVIMTLTSGVAAFNPRIFPVDIPVNGKVDISGYVTMDMAQTGALKARFGLIYE